MGFGDGFKVTLKQLPVFGGKTVTNEYPRVKRPKPVRLHGRHVLNRYEDGMEKCIGCELCAGVCPARCIYVRGADNPPDEPVSPGERYGFVYEINYLRCIHCDLCVEACPTEAITESKLFEFSFTNRQDAIYTKDELVVDDDGMPKKLPWEDWRPGEEKHTSAWVRATSPSGSAQYEGRVAWSGDLGFGVRPPEDGQTRADGPTPAQVEKEPELPAPAVTAAGGGTGGAGSAASAGPPPAADRAAGAPAAAPAEPAPPADAPNAAPPPATPPPTNPTREATLGSQWPSSGGGEAPNEGKR